MSPVNDGWTGVRTGPMRGRPLSICAKGHEPVTYTVKACPICERDERIRVLIVSIQAEHVKRCAECRQKGMR
jgi:hypothetical protein